MAKRKSKKKFIIAAIIVLAIAGAALWPRFHKPDLTISVEKEKVARRDITELVLANGKIQPVLQVKISPEVSGEITELPVKEGQAVKKGDLLVKIKPDNYISARNSAEASFKLSKANKDTAEANLQKAELEFKRNDGLFKAHLISESDFLTAKTTYDVAKTTVAGAAEQVEMAHAALQNSETDLLKTTIYSPLTGTVSKLNSELGERVVGTAMMAGTEIMTVADLNEMEARVDIGEIDVVLMAVGQKVHLEVDAFKDRKFDGIVTEVANSAKNNDTAATSTPSDATKFQIKIRLQQKEVFRPGMSVSASVETRTSTNALSIPIQCVTTRLPKNAGKAKDTDVVATATNAPLATTTNTVKSAAQKKADDIIKQIEVVFVMDGDHVKMVPVKRGISDDNYVEILEGLKEGEEIVTGGFKAINRDLEDGKKITVTVKGAGKDTKPAAN